MTMKTSLTMATFSLLGSAILAGCGPSITSERDDTIPVPAGATVAFAGAASEGEKNVDPAVQNDIVHRRIQTAIKKQLVAHGFTAAEDPAKADFLVRYYVGMQQHTEYVTTTTGVTVVSGLLIAVLKAAGPSGGTRNTIRMEILNGL